MSRFAKNAPIVGTQFSPTGRNLPAMPALRWASLRPSLAQLPRTPMVEKLLTQDYSQLELRALAHEEFCKQQSLKSAPGSKLVYGH